MNLEDIWKMVLGILVSIVGIILAIMKFSSEKYKLSLNKELEEDKSKLSNKIYISKTKFDTEFGIFRELSKAFFEMTKDISSMIPLRYSTYPADNEERKEYENKLYKQAVKRNIVYQDVLNYNIPFTPNGLYEKYNEILGLCKVQLGVFEDRCNILYLVAQEEKESF